MKKPTFRRKSRPMPPQPPIRSEVEENKDNCVICHQSLHKANLVQVHPNICNLIMKSYTYYEEGKLRITERGLNTLWEIIKNNP